MSPLELIQRVGVASLEGVIAVALVALVMRAFPRLPAATRTALWWLACARMVMALAPRVPLRWLPKDSWVTSDPLWARAGDAVRSVSDAAAPLAGARKVTESIALQLPTARPDVDPAALLATLLLGFWGMGALMWALRAWHERRQLHAAWAAATPFDVGILAGLGAARGGQRTPTVRISSAYGAPLTFGWWRPRILLPASCVQAGGDTAELALLHELAHVRRHDLLLAWIPALAQTLFWFHPLVVWAVREYAQAREEACDAEVLARADVAPRAYGELLIRYGISNVLPVTGVASCASPTSRALSRRIHMLGNPSAPSPLIRGLAVLLLAVCSLAALPVRVIAGHEAKSEEPGRSAAPDTPKKRKASRLPEDFSYLFIKKDADATRGMLNLKDLPTVERVRANATSDILLVRLGSEFYAIADEGVRKHAAELVAPIDALDEQRAPFERRMQALDARLQKLELQLEGPRARVEAYEEQAKELEAMVDQLREEGRSTDRVRQQLATVEAKRDDAELEMKRLERAMRDIERQSAPERRGNDEISEQVDLLHERMVADMRKLAEEAVARGLAQRVR